MKTKIIFILLCFLSLNVMGQGIIRRNKPKPTQTQSTKTHRQAQGKLKTKTASKPKVPTVVELKSISLNKMTLELEEGGTATLTVKYTPSNATDKTTTWKSSDVSVVKVSTNGKVTALKAGSAAIVAKCGDKDAYCNVTVKAKEIQSTGTHAGHEWIDLGLSVKWATCNVGALSPEGYGSYFAWGETSPKSEYTWANLKYCTEGDEMGNSKFSKYVTDSKYGPVDNKTHLELSDDAARANWGGSWRMPTNAEFQELINKCTWTWTTMNGKNGYKVVSKSNGNSIFLPIAGFRYEWTLYLSRFDGDYWSSSLDESDANYARSLYFNSDNHHTDSSNRSCGLSVRPVCP